MIAIGFGTGGGCPIDSLIHFLRGCRDEADKTEGTHTCSGLFTVDRAQHRELRAAVEQALALPVTLIAPEQLIVMADRVVTRSARSIEHYGVGSVAEAAALLGAGPGSRLLMPRRIFDKATCATAIQRGKAA